MERGPICLTLFGFGKWQGNGNKQKTLRPDANSITPTRA